MLPHMPIALLLDCPELHHPQPIGTSLMPHSDMKIGKTARKQELWQGQCGWHISYMCQEAHLSWRT